MTATDELRRLLDERGADYRMRQSVTNGSMSYYDRCTVLIDGNPRALIDTCNDGDVVLTLRCTPEQAIAATLGGGTCRSTTPDDAWCFACSECGKSFPRNELYLANNHGEINYCPNCGRSVKGGAE